ncbi:low temperature requirement protein A [Micromonospora sp. WMMA1923]|uniref:low temperature requirement protein A n=1 Tax=Micromonospora sp. WMMA1923 TaxID=3404125 RepID=UPI003B9556C0
MGEGTRSAPVSWGAPGSRVTRLELFYDLVFVFAFLNVTTLTGYHPGAANLYRCLLVVGLLWWCWTGFAGLGNAVRADQGILPLVGFVTVAATFLLALSMPGAFEDVPGGLNGPLVFATCYLLVRAAQLAIFGWVARGDPERLRRWALLAVLPVVAALLLVTAALLPPRIDSGGAATALQLGLWTGALALEYGAGVALGRAYWVVVSAGHWAERHAQIVLVALGESIIALGLGQRFVVDQLPLTWPVVIAAVTGIAVAAALWWAYFDTLAFAMEQALHRARDPARRGRLARDAYTFGHLPLVTGIILFALGIKDLLVETADPTSPPWGEPLGGFWILVLYGGVGLYLLGLVGCGLRAVRILRWRSLVAVVVLVLLSPVAARIPALAALVLLALVCVGLVVLGTRGEGRRRREVRRLALAQEVAAEHEASRWRREHL